MKKLFCTSIKYYLNQFLFLLTKYLDPQKGIQVHKAMISPNEKKLNVSKVCKRSREIIRLVAYDSLWVYVFV